MPGIDIYVAEAIEAVDSGDHILIALASESLEGSDTEFSEGLRHLIERAVATAELGGAHSIVVEVSEAIRARVIRHLRMGRLNRFARRNRSSTKVIARNGFLYRPDGTLLPNTHIPVLLSLSEAVTTSDTAQMGADMLLIGLYCTDTAEVIILTPVMAGENVLGAVVAYAETAGSAPSGGFGLLDFELSIFG